jgi:hypothetical protein
MLRGWSVEVGLRCGNILELCARSSAGSERLATNQKVGSSNLSGRTIQVAPSFATPCRTPLPYASFHRALKSRQDARSEWELRIGSRE